MRSSEDDALIALILSPEWAWDFPASDWEAGVVAELLEMPVYDIKRFPQEELARVGMRPNACHENARAIVERQPGAEAVAGWLVEQPDFAVHSVVKLNGHYVCVTPSRSGEEGCVFMPDPKITWTAYRGTLAPVRNGRMIAGPGVRQFPAFTIAKFRLFRERLEAGTSIGEAQITREEFDVLKRAYLPV